MMKFKSLLIILGLCATASAQSFKADSLMIDAGGGNAQSPNYHIEISAGESVVGKTASADYHLEAGFSAIPWVSTAPPTCDYATGDINGSGSFNGLDVVYGVTYLKGGPLPPYTCDCPLHGRWFVAGDVNGSCSYNGLDITYSVSYFKGGALPHSCPDCLPPTMILPPIPGIMPALSPALKVLNGNKNLE